MGRSSDRRFDGSKKAKSASVNGVDYTEAVRYGCSSGKWAWPHRRGAKTLVRALRHHGGKQVREYLCPECGRWHVGHLPQVVRHGRAAAREVYSPRG